MHIFHLSTPDEESGAPGTCQHSARRPAGRFSGLIQRGGIVLDTRKTQDLQAPTKGRSLDHIGFEVRNLESLLPSSTGGWRGVRVGFLPRWRSLPEINSSSICGASFLKVWRESSAPRWRTVRNNQALCSSISERVHHRASYCGGALRNGKMTRSSSVSVKSESWTPRCKLQVSTCSTA